MGPLAFARWTAASRASSFGTALAPFATALAPFGTAPPKIRICDAPSRSAVSTHCFTVATSAACSSGVG